MNTFEYGTPHIIWTIVLSVIFYLYHSYTTSLIFRKAGIAPWQGWVPFLNYWRLLELGGRGGWWVLVALIPFVGTILYVIFLLLAQYAVGKGFGKPGVFVLLAIFISPVWYGILAWDRSEWRPVAA